ncbi:class I SAM-dependent methyltransferase [Actinomycetes bacterium KLBMP 9797]
MNRDRQARSFGAAAAEYDQARPTYPREAVTWAVGGPPPRRVIDLGAGTGILTRVLLAAGYEVVPVEPDPQMRARLAAATPGTTALDGTAEAIPLPDGAADVVVAGQAYHWFDHDRAHPEIARVLRPGGVFAPIWNRRDDSVPWVAELSRITYDTPEVHGGFDPGDALSLGDSHFGPVERAEFHHTTTHTPDSLVTLVATRSYYLVATPEHQAEIDAGVRRLCAEHPDLAGRATFEVPYQTFVYRAVALRS